VKTDQLHKEQALIGYRLHWSCEVFGLYLERPHDGPTVLLREGGRFRYGDLKEAAAAAKAYVV
jgi:hypothetical protein